MASLKLIQGGAAVPIVEIWLHTSSLITFRVISPHFLLKLFPSWLCRSIKAEYFYDIPFVDLLFIIVILKFVTAVFKVLFLISIVM